MATTEANQGHVHPEAAAFIDDLIDTAARERLPDCSRASTPMRCIECLIAMA